MRNRAWRAALTVLVLAAGVTLGVPQAFAVLLPGGGSVKSDCYVELDIADVASTTSTKVVECTDGQPCDQDGAANDSCSFGVSICINQVLSGCQPPGPAAPLTSVTPKGAAISLPVPTDLASVSCGASTNVPVAVKVKRNGNKKKGKLKLPVIAKSPTKPKADKDKATLICNPSTGPVIPTIRCEPNPTGPNEPNEIILTVKAAGTDLDNGWKGPSFNFPTPENTQVQLCLSDCNSTTDAQCVTKTAIGEGTFNENFFGPPLPLFAAGVPVCVLNQFRPEQANELGTADLQTGAISGTIKLNSRVFITEEENVCPKCVNGRCNSGPNQNGNCDVDGQVTVSESSAANKLFPLSKDCPPNQGTPAGVLVINLPLTTGTSTLAPLPGGSPQVPCVAQPGEERGVTPAGDGCGAGTCTAGCTGTACANPNGVDPVTGATVCIDAKGGISQVCCSSDTTKACHPTRQGIAISRTGKASVPQPPWPDPTYPKTSDLVNVATFCEAATGTGSVDGLTGLPGPGALILPNTASWKTPQSP